MLTEKLTLVYFGDFSGELFDKFTLAAKTHEKYIYHHLPKDCAV